MFALMLAVCPEAEGSRRALARSTQWRRAEKPPFPTRQVRGVTRWGTMRNINGVVQSLVSMIFRRALSHQQRAAGALRKQKTGQAGHQWGALEVLTIVVGS